MRFLDVTQPTIAENLALDEALLLEAEAGRQGEVLRLWESQAFAVVLGSGCKLAEDVYEASCQADGVPIQRRSSGGGTVLLGPGCLCFTLILAYERSPLLREIPFSYAYILDRLRTVLPACERAGISDLMMDGLKFSGNAQQRKRSYLLHHGTLLYGFDLARIGRYLRMPVRRPDYRQERDHEAFVRNLSLVVDDLKGRLRLSWEADKALLAWPAALVQQLVVEKYASTEWVQRR